MLDQKKLEQQKRFHDRQKQSAKRYKDKQKNQSSLPSKVATQKKKSKKIKLPSRSKLVRKLDSVFSQYIRLANVDDNGNCVCVTCWQSGHYKTMQNWHFISRWNYKYRRDESNCHVQCYVCNILKKWNYMFYTRFMQRRLWEIRVDEMMADKELIKIWTPRLVELIEQYSNMVQAFKIKKGIE